MLSTHQISSRPSIQTSSLLALPTVHISPNAAGAIRDCFSSTKHPWDFTTVIKAVSGVQ
jgi:hypothetical protein